MHGSPSDHRPTFRRSLTAPSLAITLALMSFNFVGVNLRDALNPRDEMQLVGRLLICHPGGGSAGPHAAHKETAGARKSTMPSGLGAGRPRCANAD